MRLAQFYIIDNEILTIGKIGKIRYSPTSHHAVPIFIGIGLASFHWSSV
jgi:hypothetical protein